MPIYEYRCGRCEARVEVLVRGHVEVPSCPHCGAPLVEKLLSVPYVSSGRTAREPGRTCCGREERCHAPPCSTGETCRRDG
jgi:putative FmdB family regulatory protein